MRGKKAGVYKQLKGKAPFLTALHCVCHKLALACQQAAESVTYLKHTFDPALSSIFRFFDNSPLRSNGLRAIQAVLNMKLTRMVKVAYTRWLTHEKAVRSVRDCYAPLVIAVIESAEINKDPLAVGLCSVLSDWRFLATLVLFCDVIPIFTQLSLAFQCEDVSIGESTSSVAVWFSSCTFPRPFLLLLVLLLYVVSPSPLLSCQSCPCGGRGHQCSIRQSWSKLAIFISSYCYHHFHRARTRR
jgi:hypothetical protein